MNANLSVDIFIRSIDGSMAKIILAMLFKRGGMTIDELELRTGLDSKTLYKSMKVLGSELYQMVVSQTGAHGKVTWFPTSALLIGVEQAYFNTPDREILPLCTGEPNVLISPDREKVPLCEENPVENVPEWKNIPTWTLKKLEEESSLFKEKDSSSSLRDAGKISTNSPTVEELLEASEFLFEQPVVKRGLPVEKLTPGIVLGWLAQVYDKPGHLNVPASMVYSRLREGEMPKRKYLDEPEKYLPKNFLIEVGLAEPETPLEPEPEREDAEEPLSREEQFPGMVKRRGHILEELESNDLTEKEREKLQFMLDNINAVLGYGAAEAT